MTAPVGGQPGTKGVHHQHHKHAKKPGEQGQEQGQGVNWNNNPPVPLH